MEKDNLLTPKEVAAELRVNYRTVLREIERGNISAKKIGRIFLVTRQELDRYTSQTPRPRNLEVSVAVVYKGKKVLMVKRRQKEGKLMWQFPAGVVRFAEKTATRAVIECLEETSVHCKAVKRFGKRVHPDTNVIIHYWLCKYLSGKLHNNDTVENEQVRWVAKKAALKLGTSNFYEPVKKFLEE